MLQKYIKIVTVILLLVGFAATGMAATNVSDEFENSLYWLQKPAWDDRPSYAENISIEYSPTDLIQKRETREVCVSFTNSTNSTTGLRECESYENQTVAGESVPIFNITGDSNAYLGNGHVRTNLTVGLNDISTKTLKETTFLMDESEYIDWFNKNYYYNESNITSGELDELQGKLRNISAHGSNTNLQATRINSLEVTSLFPFRASADMTMVFRFNDFRNGRFVLSNLINVEVASSLG